MIKFKQIAVAAALAGTFAVAHADPVSITTPNGVVNGITAFDWAPSPVLAQGGNQAFVWAGAFTGVAGQAVLTYDAAAKVTTLRLDNNGDGVSDFDLTFAGQITGTSGFLL